MPRWLQAIGLLLLGAALVLGKISKNKKKGKKETKKIRKKK